MDKIQECKNILNFLNNNSTKIIEKEDFKGCYYSYINNTIYLAKEKLNTKSKEEEYIVMCHECVHSIQNKLLHAINFYSSNVEILVSIVLIILLLLKSTYIYYIAIPYFAILFINIVIRFVLESNAVKESFVLSKKLINNKYYDINKISEMQKEVKTKQLLFYISLFWKKLAKLMIIIALLICL